MNVDAFHANRSAECIFVLCRYDWEQPCALWSVNSMPTGDHVVAVIEKKKKFIILKCGMD